MNSCLSKNLGRGSNKGGGKNCKNVIFDKVYKEVTQIQNDSKGKVVSGEGSPHYRQASRVFYSKKVTPSEVESLLVRPLQHSFKIFQIRDPQRGVRSYAEVVRGNQSTMNQNSGNNNIPGGGRKDLNNVDMCQKSSFHVRKFHNEVPSQDNKSGTIGVGATIQDIMVTNRGVSLERRTMDVASQEVAIKDNSGEVTKSTPPNDGSVTQEYCETPIDQQRLIFDIKNTESDKFINSIIYNDQTKVTGPTLCKAYDLWNAQSKVKFGFIPLTDPIMPTKKAVSEVQCRDPIHLHEEVKKHDLPNYLGARIPVPSQLNIHAWETMLQGYWDEQLLECLKFGFPLGFNRTCTLQHDKENHKSAVLFPEHVSKYIEEEQKFGAIIGPFEKSPIKNLHYSPFMTRDKPNSENRRVILDLSWPRGESVNAGVEKKWIHGI